MKKFKPHEFMFSADIELSCVNGYMNSLSAAGVDSFAVLDEKLIRDLYKCKCSFSTLTRYHHSDIMLP